MRGLREVSYQKCMSLKRVSRGMAARSCHQETEGEEIQRVQMFMSPSGPCRMMRPSESTKKRQK